MNYTILPEHLHATAERVREHLRNDLGLGKVSVEAAIDVRIDFVPTLSAKTPEHYFVCVEVSESIMTPPIVSFILQCQQTHFPAKLYVAIPRDEEHSGYSRDLLRAKDSGVGVLEVNHTTGNLSTLSDPSPLSLCGLREITPKSFPRKYRGPLNEAVRTFKNGNPNKGCSAVYDEIEALTRRVAMKTYRLGLWRTPVKNPKRMEEKQAWVCVIKALRDKLDREEAKRKGLDLDSLTDPLLSRIIGITPHRNQSSHRPNSLRALKERNSRLRTRMEDATDLLLELCQAVKCLRV